MNNPYAFHSFDDLSLPTLFDSLLPAEYVWRDADRMADRKRWEVEDGVRRLILEEISPEASQIVRLISPNPEDYMNPAYSPGRMIYARYHL